MLDYPASVGSQMADRGDQKMILVNSESDGGDISSGSHI